MSLNPAGSAVSIRVSDADCYPDHLAVRAEPQTFPTGAIGRPVHQEWHPVPPGATPDWSDGQLVEACLGDDEQAWALLVARYKRLIYSFPRRYGAAASDAADVFQLVCAELYLALPRLRHHDRVCSWIMTVAAHQAYRWKCGHVTRARREGTDPVGAMDTVVAEPSSALEHDERDRVVRAAIARLPARSREVVRLLFYEDPPVPYEAVAARLGLSIGSIGVIRSRSLEKLKRLLEPTGYAPVELRRSGSRARGRRSGRRTRTP